jgi:elongation factor G
MDELVLDLVTSGPAPMFSSGQYEGAEACAFGIQNSSSDPFLLGDTFLRSAYVVYDLVNNQIGMAQTDFNATASNIVAFESHGAQIPFATLASNQSLTTSTSTFTEPAFVAESGFANGTQDSGSVMVSRPGWEPLAVGGAAMLVSLFGGGLFLV